MKRSSGTFIKGLLLILVTLAMISCQSKKPAKLTETDATALQEFNDKGLTMAKELNKDNAEAFVKFTYTEDAVIYPPALRPIFGHEALIGFYQNYPPMTDFNQKIEEFEVFNDYAYLRLSWSIPVVLSDLETFTNSGVIFAIMKKQEDGSWKIWREIWNSDVSLPPLPLTNP